LNDPSWSFKCLDPTSHSITSHKDSNPQPHSGKSHYKKEYWSCNVSQFSVCNILPVCIFTYLDIMLEHICSYFGRHHVIHYELAKWCQKISSFV